MCPRAFQRLPKGLTSPKIRLQSSSPLLHGTISSPGVMGVARDNHSPLDLVWRSRPSALNTGEGLVSLASTTCSRVGLRLLFPKFPPLFYSEFSAPCAHYSSKLISIIPKNSPIIPETNYGFQRTHTHTIIHQTSRSLYCNEV